MTRQIQEMYLILLLRSTCLQRLGGISWVIGRWKSDKQARDVRGRCIDSCKFFRILLDETTANMYFLVPFYCSGHCLEITGNKNNLRLLFSLKPKKMAKMRSLAIWIDQK